MHGLNRRPGDWVLVKRFSIEISILNGNEASWGMLKPFGFTPELTQYRVTRDEYIPPEEDA
jgi:hypothetical protein